MTTTTPADSNEPTTTGTASVDVPITFSLDLSAVLKAAGYVGEDEDGEPVYGPVLGEMIAKAIAEKAVTRTTVDEWTVSKRVQGVLDERIGVIVDEALRRRWAPTDQWGNAKGVETSMTEEIQKALQKWLTHRPSADRYDRDKTPCLQTYLADTVDVVVKKDLDGALAEARRTVTQRVKDQAAQLITATITKMAGGLS